MFSMRNIMRVGAVLAVGLAVTLSMRAVSREKITPEKIMEISDRYRGGLESGVTWNIRVDTVEDDERSTNSYLVKAKGVNAVVECLSPARCKGEVMLFNDRNLWFLKPGVRKPVAISARQRLSGQAANGDIASTNYARDYDATFVKKTKIDNQDCWEFDLKAKTKNVTYDRIRYWISQKRRLALKAEFLTLGGDLFKTATFEYKNSIVSRGKKIPFVSKMKIVDAAFAENVTTLTYENPKEEEHFDSIFNINNIMR